MRPPLGPRSDAAIIISDRDPAVRRLVGRGFRREGFEAHELDDPRRIADRLEAISARLVVLELGAELDFEPLTRLRESSDIPVVGLLWVQPDADEATALDLGADDCLGRPFSLRHLMARTRAVLRRAEPHVDGRLRFDGLVIDRDSRTVTLGDRPVHLAAREFDLLAFLASRPAVAFTRDELLAEVWNSSAAWQQRETVTEHIHRLRARLEVNPARPQLLVTVRGVGYRFAPPSAPR
jgi:DNA-binding response OmpR family regulator